MQPNQLKPPPSSIGTMQQISQAVRFEHNDIKQILHWYKDEFILVKDVVAYRDAQLTGIIGFSPYPFIKGSMPFISSNLINLAVDQTVLVHLGLMIKSKYISVNICGSNGLQREMSFEDFNRIVGDEFVTARLRGQYKKPIPPYRSVRLKSEFLQMRNPVGSKYFFTFKVTGELYFAVDLIVAYPLNTIVLGTCR